MPSMFMSVIHAIHQIPKLINHSYFRVSIHFTTSVSSLNLVPFFAFLKIYFIDYAIIVVPSFPLCPSPPGTPHSLQQSPHHSSCPWVMHISSLASPFPILFLTSTCLFCTYQLCFLFPVLFPHSPLAPRTNNLPCDLHFYDSVPFLVCLVCFCFVF